MSDMRKWIDAVNEKKDDPCWDGYRQLGMKKKGGKKASWLFKEVPN